MKLALITGVKILAEFLLIHVELKPFVRPKCTGQFVNVRLVGLEIHTESALHVS